MESYLTPEHYDLVTPDGKITQIKEIDKRRKHATVQIESISPAFVGFDIDKASITFNLKSTLAQLLSLIHISMICSSRLGFPAVKEI